MASIAILADGVEEKYALESVAVTLGRGLESDIRLKDIKASRRHCQILKTAKGYQCVDLSSGNGTYINGVQIKQQMLNPGDKIQIGSTTVTFHDGAVARPAPAPAAPPPPTDRQRAAAATAVVPKTSAVKTASGPVPTTQTKKITTKVPTVKPATQPVVKIGTQSVPKPGTSSVRKMGTQRGGSTRATGKVSATQRFHAEARRKKANPVAIIIGCIGAAFLITVGWIMFAPSGDSVQMVKDSVERLTKEAQAMDAQSNFDGAIKKYQEALNLVKDSDKFKTAAVELRGAIKELDQRRDLMKGADSRFAAFKARFEKAGDGEASELLQEGKKMKLDYETSNVTWIPDLKQILERLEKMLDTQAQISKRMDFQFRRNEINAKHSLADTKGGAHWSNALKDWKDFLAQTKNDETKNKVENEMRILNARAKNELDLLAKRAERLNEENKKAEALDLLKQQRARFEHTNHADELEKLIQKYDK